MGRPFNRFLAIVIMLLGMLMPALEFVPFSSSIVAAAISLFSLALLFRDGLLALLAVATLLGSGYAIYNTAFI